MLRRIALLATLALALGGCGWFKSTNSDNVEPPTELQDLVPTASVQQLWSRSFGDGEDRLGLRRAPAFDSGRLYVAGGEGRVWALEGSSGRELWQVETGVPLSSSPAPGEGLVVVGGLDGEVIALDAESGAERWRAQASSEVIARPLVTRGTVVVRSNDGRLFGFDAADGSRRWLYDRGLPSLTLRGNAAPLAVAGSVYAGYDDGQVVSLRLEDGSLQWQQAIAVGEGRTDIERLVDIDGALALGPSELYAASYNGQAASLALESGRPLWSREISSYGGLALSGDRLVIADADGELFALDRRSGSALWRQDGLAHRWLSTPAVHDAWAVVGDLEGYLHWVALDSGQFAARARVGGDPIRAQPVVGDGIAFAVTTSGQLAAYRIEAR